MIDGKLFRVFVNILRSYRYCKKTTRKTISFTFSQKEWSRSQIENLRIQSRMSGVIPLSDEDLHELYLWVDDIPLSRPKRNIARDFSDGVCVAETVKYYFPKLVELHNYTAAHSIQQKIANWNTLNARVFRKLHFEVPMEEIRDITSAVPGSVERFLRALRTKISQVRARQAELSPRDYILNQQQHSAPRESSRPQSANPPMSARTVEKNQNQALHSDRVVAAAYTGSHSHGGAGAAASNGQSLRQLLDEKDRAIYELKETVALLNEKVAKLEELARVKDSKINSYKQRLGS